MTTTADLKDRLCRTFCADLTVREVPAGLAVSATFSDAVGDRIGCFIEQTPSGWRLVDDGEFLADLVGRGIDVASGSRADFLSRALGTAGATWDKDTLQIVTNAEASMPPPERTIAFMTALLRARDVTFWTRERVRSTFKDDAFDALVRRFGSQAEILRQASVDDEFSEFPADVVLRTVPDGLSPVITAVFLVQTIEALTEALVLWSEVQRRRRTNILVTALVEDGSLNLSGPKAQRALNRIDTLTVYRNDEAAALDRIGRTAQTVAH